MKNPTLGEVLAVARDTLAGMDDAPNAFEALDELVRAIDAPATELADEVPELMGAKEACDTLEVASGNLRKMAGLPKPVQSLAMGDVWRAKDIRALAAARNAKRETIENV